MPITDNPSAGDNLGNGNENVIVVDAKDQRVTIIYDDKWISISIPVV